MEGIETIDLWTEQNDNHFECFECAFIDGLSEENIPFDSYKVIKNCNCEITCSDKDLNISNKHGAIVFYKDEIPVRLMVINKNTNIEDCIEKALNQTFLDIPLKNIFESFNIKGTVVDLGKEPIYNGADHSKEIYVGSCDRPELLSSMLEGSYTEADTGFGKENNDTDFHFRPNIAICYNLLTDNEWFFITHSCAFINSNKTRIIPLQNHSKLDLDQIRNSSDNNKKHL